MCSWLFSPDSKDIWRNTDLQVSRTPYFFLPWELQWTQLAFRAALIKSFWMNKKTEKENWSPHMHWNTLTACKAHSLITGRSAVSTKSPKRFAQVGESHDVLGRGLIPCSLLLRKQRGIWSQIQSKLQCWCQETSGLLSTTTEFCWAPPRSYQE